MILKYPSHQQLTTKLLHKISYRDVLQCGQRSASLVTLRNALCMVYQRT